MDEAELVMPNMESHMLMSSDINDCARLVLDIRGFEKKRELG